MHKSEAQTVMELLSESGPMSAESISESTGIPLLKIRSVIGYLRTTGRLDSNPMTYQVTDRGRAGDLRAYRPRQGHEEPTMNSGFGALNSTLGGWHA